MANGLPRALTIPRLFTDDAGRTHLDTVEIELGERRGVGCFSTTIPARGVQFWGTAGPFDLGLHPAPRRQLMVNLEGSFESHLADGSVIHIMPGSIILVEDTTGEGHMARS